MTISRRSGSIALFVTLAVLAVQSASSAQQKPAPAKPLLTVYKTPTCGCCSKWVEHMRANGFDAKVHELADLTEIRAKLGVPAELGSCRTAQVGRYVVEGHIPADAVHRLLKERPTTITGITVPGMPLGSPGMEVPGGSVDPYLILTFDRAGHTTVFERRPR
jgi:hypothetical protein